MFDLKKTIMSLAAVLLTAVSLSAQRQADSLVVYFHSGSAEFDRDYRQNGDRCDDFLKTIGQLPDHMTVVKVEYTGVTSPEDTHAYNERLSRRRAENVVSFLHEHLKFDDSVVFINSVVEDWETLETYVENDLQTPDREAVLDIIRSDLGEHRESTLRKLNEGAAWNYLFKKYFPELRYCRVIVTSEVGLIEAEVVLVDEEVEAEDTYVELEDTAVEVAPMPVAEVVTEVSAEVEQAPEEGWRHITLKTNLIGWGFTQANIAAEVDIIKHLSFALPVYYSGGFDVVKDKVKFRGLVFQPELRYYPWLNKKGANGGFFIGAHFGLGWYNFALGGDYRTQDHQGRRPSYGGGLGIGGSFQFRRNPHWGMEFAVGGGVYDSKYDLFYNEANGPYYKKGVRKIWYGIDNASISFTYKFDVKQKGGKK